MDPRAAETRKGGAVKLHLRSDAKAEARALVLEHHYSHRWPNAPSFVVTWHEEGGLFGDRGPAVAAVIFSPTGVWKETTTELSRLVRTPGMGAQLTGLIAAAVREIRRQGFDSLLVSYADPAAGHHGGIYQAASWRYGGQSKGERIWIIDGVEHNRRSIQDIYGTSSYAPIKAKLGDRLKRRECPAKHLYWRALNRRGKAKAKRLGLKSLPYPKPGRVQ